MNTTTESQSAPSPASRLGSVRVGMRDDLEVTRHLFRQEPCYIVRDPMTFQSQRLEPADYEIFASITADKTLAEVLSDLIARDKVSEQDEDSFYQFVMGLHRLGFLRLPISDDKSLYQRYQARERARRREKLMGFLFLRIPVWNPDAFLDRTMKYARPLYGRVFFVLWLLLAGSAIFVVARNWDRLTEPLQGLLGARNLALMWITLVVLKVFHEFGHAYACKHFGGHVPEMGIYLIAFTPCAYVDATASWGFTRKGERLIVCFGGMYVEAFFASLAVLIWAFTGPSLLNSLAYNVIFLASVVTVLFNINPLMRYDGYYIFSDLVEVPNLRARATKYVVDGLKRIALGIHTPQEQLSRRLRAILVGFGISAALYRVVLILGIAAMLASKMFIVGALLAVFFVGSTVIRILRKLTTYLWLAEETAAVRIRAVAISVVVLLLIPAMLVLVPLPAHVLARGIVTTEIESVVRARTSGYVHEPLIVDGQLVESGDLLVRLASDECQEEVAEARANLRAAQVRRDAFLACEPDRAGQEEARINGIVTGLRQAEVRSVDLDVRSPVAGRVIDCISHNDLGRYLYEGEPVATVAAGRWQVRAILSESEVAGVRPRIGEEVEFRAADGTLQPLTGTVARVNPVGSRFVELLPVTQLGGGYITVDPMTGEATEPYFEVTIDLPSEDSRGIRHGMTGFVRLSSSPEPLARKAYRGLNRFVNRLLQE